MDKKININLIKENPQLFFSKLDKDAEKEFSNLLEFIVFKYDITFDAKSEKKSYLTHEDDFLNFIENNKITLPNNFKFDRNEANDR
jgi:hypothetical protein